MFKISRDSISEKKKKIFRKFKKNKKQKVQFRNLFKEFEIHVSSAVKLSDIKCALYS